MWRKGNSCILLVERNINWCGYYEKPHAYSFKKLKTELPFGPAILFMGIYHELKSGSQINICISALLCSLENYSP